METVDARGLSCPQPVLMTVDALKKTSADRMLVLVDTAASKENVSRAVSSNGWTVADITPEGETYRIEIHKG
ncbi:MAG: sulfurtransferase TusA family protein [Thermodesulfobacteriota bacterium]